MTRFFLASFAGIVIRSIEVEDAIYPVTRYYREGAMSCRTNGSWLCNPYRDGSAHHDEWNWGYENEEEGRHLGVKL